MRRKLPVGGFATRNEFRTHVVSRAWAGLVCALVWGTANWTPLEQPSAFATRRVARFSTVGASNAT